MANLPPPGWYPDPWTPGAQRWWDGTQWAAQTGAAPPTVPAPPAPRRRVWPWVVGIVGVLVLLVGGCTALLAVFGVGIYRDVRGVVDHTNGFYQAVESRDAAGAYALLCPESRPAEPTVFEDRLREADAAVGGFQSHFVHGVASEGLGQGRAVTIDVDVTTGAGSRVDSVSLRRLGDEWCINAIRSDPPSNLGPSLVGP